MSENDFELEDMIDDMSDEEANEVFDLVFLKPMAEKAGIYLDTEELLAQIEEQENAPAILNPDKMLQMQVAYKILKQVAKRTGAEVTYELQKPFKSMGSVSLVGDNISFKNPEWLVKLSQLASVVDIYPTSGGKTMIDFTFHGLTVGIDL